MSETFDSWCIFTLCPRKGPIRGDPNWGIRVCDHHWDIVTKELQDKLKAIMNHTEPFIEWGGPQGTSYRVRLHKHPELQKYVSELMRVLYGLSA